MSTELRADRRTLANARVVTPERVIEDGYVVVEGDRIAEVGREGAPTSGATIDADGRLVVPGFVDIHGDDLERFRFPRTGAAVDLGTALVSCDRANVAAGITTKFHAVAFENAAHGERSVRLAREATDAVASVDGLLGDNRVNARCEIGDDRAVEAVLQALDRDVVGLVSLMNHLPESGQFDDLEQFKRRYGIGDRAERVRERRRRVPAGAVDVSIRRVVDGASAAGVPVASHDDESAAEIDAMAALDVAISEYPVTMAAARRATELGMVTAMGAPNLVRGGSLWGNLSAAEAIRSGAVDVLCTDYHPASLLETVCRDAGESLPDRVARVTAAPAEAVGLPDRGRIEPGARADLVVVEPSTPPKVRRAVVGGEAVYRAAASP